MSTDISPATVAANGLVRLNGALCVQRGTPMLQAYADPGLLVQQSRIDVHNPTTGRGYQRTLVTSRIGQTCACRKPHPPR